MANKFRPQPTPDPIEASPALLPDEPTPVDPPKADATETVAEENVVKKPRRRLINRVLGADVLGNRFVVRQIPVVLLVMFYLLLMVSHRYRVERLMRDKIETTEHIELLRQKRIQMQKRLQERTKISQIADDLVDRGVGITAGPPYEIKK